MCQAFSFIKWLKPTFPLPCNHAVPVFSNHVVQEVAHCMYSVPSAFLTSIACFTLFLRLCIVGNEEFVYLNVKHALCVEAVALDGCTLCPCCTSMHFL